MYLLIQNFYFQIVKSKGVVSMYYLKKTRRMVGKDTLAEKLLMFNDVFAEFVNGIMFDGEEVVKEDELFDLSGWSQYKGDDSKYRFQDRDVVKL